MSQTAILSRPAGFGFASGCLARPAFDLLLIAGTASLAMGAGMAAWLVPALFVPILLADLWLLGYQHVIATFTRLAFDPASRRQHGFLLYVLPWPILLGVVLMIAMLGLWTVPTLYLYWQWFHYTRQSYGIGQAYRRKAGVGDDTPRWLQLATFYALPLWGILHRSAAAPDRFLGMEIWALPVPVWLADAVGVAALGLLGAWLVDRWTAFRQGRLALAHTAFLGSHFAIFLVGYILIPSLDHGWLIINIWHNAQYVLFVWLFNRNRYRNGREHEARLLSWLVQPGRAWAYFGFCIAISTAIYLPIVEGLAAFAAAVVVPLSLILFQTINFHHYIVDSLIWKMRKAPLRATLGIAA